MLFPRAPLCVLFWCHRNVFSSAFSFCRSYPPFLSVGRSGDDGWSLEAVAVFLLRSVIFVRAVYGRGCCVRFLFRTRFFVSKMAMNRPKFVSKVSKSPPHWGKNWVEVEVSPLFSRDAIHGQPKRYRVRTLVTLLCAPIWVGGGRVN